MQGPDVGDTPPSLLHLIPQDLWPVIDFYHRPKSVETSDPGHTNLPTSAQFHVIGLLNLFLTEF